MPLDDPTWPSPSHQSGGQLFVAFHVDSVVLLRLDIPNLVLMGALAADFAAAVPLEVDHRDVTEDTIAGRSTTSSPTSSVRIPS